MMSKALKHHVYLFWLAVLLLGGVFQIQSARAQESSQNEDTAIEQAVTYTSDLLTNVRGGRDTGLRYMDNIDLELRLNLEKMIGLDGSEMYLYGLGNQGGSISELAGDIQGISNIEAEPSWRLYEAWIQKYLYRLHTSVLIGIYDINSEFDVINTGQLFLNSSHGIGPEFALSGVLGPSTFPYTSIGVRVKTNPVDGLVFKTAILDGIPSNPQNTDGTKIFLRKRDGILAAAEISYYSNGESSLQKRDKTVRLRHYLGRGVSGDNRYKVAVGGWWYSKKREGWIGASGAGYHEKGLYLLGELRIFQEAEDPFQGLSSYGRVGIASESINPFKGYAGGGLVYTGLFRNRDRDQAGLALGVPLISSDYQNFLEQGGTETADSEVNLELTYLYLLNSMVSLQLDLQFIRNPGMVEEVDDALVAGVRFQVSL